MCCGKGPLQVFGDAVDTSNAAVIIPDFLIQGVKLNAPAGQGLTKGRRNYVNQFAAFLTCS